MTGKEPTVPVVHDVIVDRRPSNTLTPPPLHLAGPGR